MFKRDQRHGYRFWHSAAQCFFGAVVLALLTYVCFRLRANPTTVALLYLIVIVAVSLTSNFIPAAFVSIVAYICLDSLFTAPLFRPAMREPLDVVAPIAFLTTSFVITRLMSRVRKSFQEIQALKDQLRLAIDTIPGLVWSALPDGSAEFLNQRWLEYTGLSLKDGLDWGGKVAVHPEDLARLMDEWRTALTEGKTLETEARLRKTVTEKARLDINQTIREVVTLTRNEAAGKGVAIRMELAAGLPPVLGDRVQLQQVILNLIVNGIEAMASVADQPRELLISSRQHESDKALITVRDSGAGLGGQDLERIFDAFYTTKSQGLGMGLALSRSIVEDHGGRLWVVANEGPGATFQFTLLKYQ